MDASRPGRWHERGGGAWRPSTRHAAVLALVTTGCRAVLGIEDAPEGPGGATSGDPASTGVGPSSSSGEGAGASTSGTGGEGGGEGGASTASTGSASTGGGGSGGGPTCEPCGGVECCYGDCAAGVCTSTWDLGGAGQRLVDAGSRVAVVVLPEVPSSVLQWVRTDHVGALPPACAGPGDGTGQGYLASRAGAVFYSTNTAVDGGAGGAIRLIGPTCNVSTFAQSSEFGGLHARSDGLLAVDRDATGGATVVRCFPFAGGSCRPAAVQLDPAEGFDVAVDGDLAVWTALTNEGAAVLLQEGLPPTPLFAAFAPVDLIVPEPGQHWVLGVDRAANTAIVRRPAQKSCTFPQTGALGFEVEAGRVYLPHTEGLVVCGADFGSCVIDPQGPMHDILLTPSALWFTVGTRLVRVQRPLDDYLAGLSLSAPCVADVAND